MSIAYSGAGTAAAEDSQLTVTPQTITTIAGNGQRGSSGDAGMAVNAQLNAPGGVALDASGSLLIVDRDNNRVRKVVNPTTLNQDVITTAAGTGVRGFSGDGGRPNAADLDRPEGIAVDPSGDIFIADTGNNRVREVLATGVIETIAGDGTCTHQVSNGEPAVHASLCRPQGVAVAPSGLVYIADTGHRVVRVVASNGRISDLAGTGKAGRSGDGGLATAATLGAPADVTVNTVGDVFIADSLENDIREVSPSGLISTFAGTGQPGFSGDEGPASRARLRSPTGLGVDQSDSLYIADTGNDRVRVVEAGGQISTLAGSGRRGFSGDGGPAGDANLDLPTGPIAIDGAAVYFADSENERVRGVFTGPTPILPETTYAVMLPVSAVVVLAGCGGVYWLRRRSKQR